VIAPVIKGGQNSASSGATPTNRAKENRPEIVRFRPAFVCPVGLQNLHPRLKSWRLHRALQGARGVAVRGRRKGDGIGDVSNAQINREMTALKRVFSLAVKTGSCYAGLPSGARLRPKAFLL
jgi:hypothetical protein